MSSYAIEHTIYLQLAALSCIASQSTNTDFIRDILFFTKSIFSSNDFPLVFHERT